MALLLNYGGKRNDILGYSGGLAGNSSGLSSSSGTSSGGSTGGGKFYGGPFASTNLSDSKYKKYQESLRNKTNNDLKMFQGAAQGMIGRIQAGPGQAFSPQQLQMLHQQGLQQLQQDEQGRMAGLANSAAARGTAGPNAAAILGGAGAAQRRGSLAMGDLNAQVQGLGLGVEQYNALNSGFGNVRAGLDSARGAYSGQLNSMRPGQYQDPVAAQQAQFEQQNQQQASQIAAQQALQGGFGGGGGGGSTTSGGGYGSLGGGDTRLQSQIAADQEYQLQLAQANHPQNSQNGQQNGQQPAQPAVQYSPTGGVNPGSNPGAQNVPRPAPAAPKTYKKKK